MNHSPLRTFDLRIVEAAVDAWAGEHGFRLERLAFEHGEAIVRLAPHPEDLTDFIRHTLQDGNTPVDWEDEHALMDGSSASWDWAVALAAAYNRTRIVRRLWEHDRSLRGVFAHHHPGTVEIQILEVNPAQVFHHLTVLKHTR